MVINKQDVVLKPQHNIFSLLSQERNQEVFTSEELKSEQFGRFYPKNDSNRLMKSVVINLTAET